MKTLLMLLVLLTTFLHAEIDENLFLASKPDVTSIPIKPIELKEPYVAKFKKVDYANGEISYFIFHKNNQDQPVGTYSHIHKGMLNATKINEEDIKNKIAQLREQSVIEDSQTPALRTRPENVLDLGKFLVACMSVDSQYIDTANTMLNNKVTLQNGYTRAFNENVLDEKALLFYIRLFVNIDNFLQTINSNVFFLFVIYILGGTAISAVIAKMEDRDIDSMWERGVFAFVILIGFYLAPTVNLNEQKEVTRTHFQTLYTGYVLELGVKVANDVTDVLNKTFNAYHARNSGKLDMIELENVLKNQQKNVKILPLYQDLYDKCQDLYDTTNNNMTINDLGFVFPEKLALDTLTGTHYTERSIQKDKTVFIPFSLSLCHFAEQQIKVIQTEQATNEKTLSDYTKFISYKSNEMQLKKIHEMQNDYVYQYGFIASPLIALNNMFAQNINMFERSTTNQSQIENAITEKNKNNGLQKGIVADSVIGDVVESLPYMLVPGAGTLKDAIGGTIGKVTSSITGLLEKAPVIGKLISKLSEGIQEGVNIAFAIMLLKYVFPNLPILALMVSSFLVLLYYFISIAIYINVSPFLASWAFARGQTNQLKTFGIRGVIIALKPIVLVITIAFATIGLDLLYSLQTLLITEQFDNFFNMTMITSNVQEYILGDHGLLFFKGTVSIFINTSAMILAFYIVFKGADLVVYKILGLPQNGGDVQSTIGDSVQNKTKM